MLHLVATMVTKFGENQQFPPSPIFKIQLKFDEIQLNLSKFGNKNGGYEI
jgi:hypothetical protein